MQCTPAFEVSFVLGNVPWAVDAGQKGSAIEHGERGISFHSLIHGHSIAGLVTVQIPVSDAARKARAWAIPRIRLFSSHFAVMVPENGANAFAVIAMPRFRWSIIAPSICFAGLVAVQVQLIDDEEEVDSVIVARSYVGIATAHVSWRAGAFPRLGRPPLVAAPMPGKGQVLKTRKSDNMQHAWHSAILTEQGLFAGNGPMLLVGRG